MDDLFKPSLQDQTKVTFDQHPFSARAQYIVTFFGGVAAGWFFSVINTGRLKTDTKTYNRVQLIWALSTVILLIAYGVIASQIELDSADREIQRYLRYGNRIFAVVINLIIRQIQDPWFKRHAMISSLNADVTYDNAWKIGLLAVFIIPIPLGLLTLWSINIGSAYFGA